MNRPLIYRLALLAIGIHFCFQGLAQSNYDDYRPQDKVFKYREDFNSDSDYWEYSVSGKSASSIRNGALVFQSLNDRTQAKYVSLPELSWTGDWELEIGLRWVNGKESSAIDLIWDRTPGQSRKYHFGFTAGRKYTISEYNEGFQKIVNFTQADFVYRTTRNRMTVRHVNGIYYFFVNERFVKKHPAKAITGKDIGFTVPPGSVIEVDYLYARQLKKITRPNSGYFGVMSKNNGYTLQRYKRRDNFPKEEIKSDWSAGYSISSLSYENGEWVLINSKGTGYTTQTWMTRREWKKEDIKAKWNEGYVITELSYGNGVYAIVFSKTQALGRQRWATKVSSFPSDKIKEFGDEGLTITKVIYGKDRWVLLATKDTRIKNQKWFKRSKFPAEDIEKYTTQGYSIAQLSQENGWWVLVMNQYHGGNQPSVWFRSKVFPKDKIRQYWDQGYYLTEIVYNNPKSTTTLNTSNTSTTTAKKRWDLKSKLLGRWYGGAEGEAKGYMTFYTDEILMMMSNGETIGGYEYEQDGEKIEVKYKLNSFNTPNQLDIVFYSKGKSFGKMKGIIRFKDDKTFEFKLAPGFSSPRPSSFTSTADSKVSTFKRVN